MRALGFDDFRRINSDGQFVDAVHTTAGSIENANFWANPVDWDGPYGTVTPGNLDGAEVKGDYIELKDLVAGVTYSFAMRPTAEGGVIDPYLELYKADKTTSIIADDDGGAGRSSLLTFTPTESGTYYLLAGSWVNLFSTGGDSGDYEIYRWDSTTAPDAPNSMAGALTMTEGQTIFGQFPSGSPTDIDMYKIELGAGRYYTFNFSGGAASNAELGEQGTIRAQIDLLDSEGHVVATGLSAESAMTYLSEAGGTYYVRVTPNAGVLRSGYTLDASSVVLAERDPLEAFNWDSANDVPFVDTDGDGVVDTAYIYFGKAGQNFGMLQGEAGSTEELLSFGFNDLEKERILAALNNEYGELLGINYVETSNVNKATFRLVLTEDEPYGARFLNYSPQYGQFQGIGVFVRDNAAWSFDADGSLTPDTQQSLLEGGYDYNLILHEFGHAHGIAHPHDNGGGSEIMVGVTATTGSYGAFNLNQGVYSVMSYNDGWDFHPNGGSELWVESIGNGWSGSLSAFDIAILQERYGLVDRNTGNTTYTLTDVVTEAFYETIWDTGGIDTIAYAGDLNAQIDLTAATLDYSATGGGALSFLYNEADIVVHTAFRLRGGFTIANGVVIENATGGSGDDILIGNDIANVLDGRDGSDTVVYALADSAVTVHLDTAEQTAVVGDVTDTLVSIEGAVGSRFDDTMIGNAADNTFEGGAGNDVMVGGDGTDTASYAASALGVTVDLGVETAQNTGNAGVDTLSSFENVTGGSGNDTLTGTDGDNVINGGAGNDVMSGLGGNDTLSYAGNLTAGVTVNLGLTTQQNTVGGGSDTISGFENLIGTRHGDTLQGTAGDNVLDGALGVDRVSYALAAAGVVVNLSLTGPQNTIGAGTDTLISFENLTGSGFADQLTGTAGNNDISGGGGADIIDGGAGNDTLTGGLGDDTLIGGDGTGDTASYATAGSAVTVNLVLGTGVGSGGATVNTGTDTLSGIENATGSAFADTLTGSDINNVLSGGAGVDTISGGLGNDTLNGGDGDDLLNGGEGNDTMNGDANNDTLNGDAGNDTLNGGAGNDTLNGGAGTDTLNGGDGDDTLRGNDGNDRIVGGIGVDTVYGGDGIDVVTLGAGDDVFKAEITASKTKLSSGTMSVDIITDFDANGNDWIDLSGLGTFKFGGTSSNNKAGDLTYKTYASVAAAEAALNFDIDGQPGAAGIGGPVTIVYGNIDGKSPDFAIVLLNTNGVDASDFAAPPAPAAAATAAAAALSGSSSAVAPHDDFGSLHLLGSMTVTDYHLI